MYFQNLKDVKKKYGRIFSENELPYTKFNFQTQIMIFKLEKIYELLNLEELIFSNMHSGDKDMFIKINQMKGNSNPVGIIEEILDAKKIIVSTTAGFEVYTNFCTFINPLQLTVGRSVLLNPKTFCIVGVVGDDVDSKTNMLKHNINYSDNFNSIGGLSEQIQEIKETIELPLIHPEVFLNVGISPPKGIILYGEPGTGKTLLAKAVANSTKACFIKISGSELVQKFLGEGPRLVREIFNTARYFSPSIVFIDEIDAVGTIRKNSSSGGEKEVQRTMLELLNQLDGFDSRENIKIIMATNRIDSLDPALIRPGRIDRKIEFPLPNDITIRYIFQVHTKNMNINRKINIRNFLRESDGLSGADIKSICTEAALLALRSHRLVVYQRDLVKARNFVLIQKREFALSSIYV
ncbi:26S proteasome AAA-ATPase subunit (nucleomorph) [Cryptomonas paramecium]|uniref:26S proteasome AAA-ATPase subunit n=1 Tax=Cryptomonas paramaecium TaxID=2898 RepID=F2HIB4_9CRYP|nr:26S proteasome AAA-ATPase subunit [Cryptomonas paramecium]AEA39038.1 26S proteasome AAA-ATPase subunit [Cryptomonas paramecium]|mmetsp:Transcript_52135/g.136249  ORF Transcript_52135/g.136249 Transcript_52135/m.136249 type:complete len:408 (-) Transcript_52135:5324-6547(-)